VVIEGFSAGRPVVAAAIDGPAALISPGQTGLLVPPEDPSALAEALRSVLEDPELAERLGRAGRADFEANHAEAPVVARWQVGLRLIGGG
jgi:glycosyltransferase involved in cell wall biosynthesis